MADDIKVVGFDADDTLWVNELYFRQGEEAFCRLMADFKTSEQTMKLLFDIEMKNLALYGYGVKGFVLSMMETATLICEDKLDHIFTNRILDIGKEMLDKPVVLLDEVEAILQRLVPHYRLVLVTKGDLLDQERKLEKSGLTTYFHHVEVMSNKKEKDYLKLIGHLDIDPKEFVMIGNSLRSDILPVIEIGAHALYVPHELTWQHELVDDSEASDPKYYQVERLSQVLEILDK